MDGSRRERVADELDVDRVCARLDQEPIEYAVCFGSVVSGTLSARSDIDLGLRFAETVDKRERFRRRNRIDADLQSATERFLDVSDIEELPDQVALNALEDGLRMYGDEGALTEDKHELRNRIEATGSDRSDERQSVLQRLAERAPR